MQQDSENFRREGLAGNRTEILHIHGCPSFNIWERILGFGFGYGEE